MDEILETIRWFWAPISAVIGWGLWSLRKATASKEELKEMDHRLDRHDRRLGKLEIKLESLPSKDDLHHLETSLIRLEGQIKPLQQAIDAQSAAIKRIEDYLLNKDKS